PAALQQTTHLHDSPTSCPLILNTTPTTDTSTLSLHDALPIWSKSGTPRSPNRSRTRSSYGGARPARVTKASCGSCRSARARRRRSEEHTSELQSRGHLVCRLLLEKKNGLTEAIWLGAPDVRQ